jgi:hypothetical protein
MRKPLAAFCLKAALFLAIVIPIYLVLARQYGRAAALNHVNAWNRQRVSDFYGLAEDSLNLLFLGSSHSYCSFDPQLIDSAMGIQSFQFGMPQAHADTSYFSLQLAMKTQKPSAVVMEVYWDMLDDDFDINQADTFLQAFDGRGVSKDYISEIFPWNEKIKYAIPTIRNQLAFLTYENTRLTGFLKARFGGAGQEEAQAGTERYGDRGFMYCDYVITDSKLGAGNQFIGLDGSKWAFSKVQEGYLKKIASLCAENSIQLLFVTAPVAPASMGYITNYTAIHDKIADFAQKEEIPYLDYNIVNQTEHLFENINFRDDAHLNYSGVLIADKYLENWLSAELGPQLVG